MTFGTKRDLRLYTIDAKPHTRVTKIKYLGICFDTKLTFYDHIEYTSSVTLDESVYNVSNKSYLKLRA